MASRYFSEFADHRIGRPNPPPAPGGKGVPGAEAAKQKVTERTASWPTPGPMRAGGGFNRKTKVPTVKVSAKHAGCDA